jgi:hypothetical protein
VVLRINDALARAGQIIAVYAPEPLSIVLTAGQSGDSPQFTVVLDGIRVPRLHDGRPRTRRVS